MYDSAATDQDHREAASDSAPATVSGTEISVRCERSLLQELSHLIAERAQAETTLRNGYTVRNASAAEQFAKEQRRLEERQRIDLERLKAQHSQALSLIVGEFESTTLEAAHVYDDRSRSLIEQADRAKDQGQSQWERARAEAEARATADEQELETSLVQAEQRLEEQRRVLAELEARMKRLLRKRRVRAPAEPPPARRGGFRVPEPQAIFNRSLQAAQAALAAGEQLPSARFLRLPNQIPLFLGTWLLTLFAAVILFRPGNAPQWWAIAASGAAAVLVLAGTYAAVRPRVRRGTLARFQEFQQLVAHALEALDQLRDTARDESARKREQRQARLRLELQNLDERWRARQAELASQREQSLRDARDQYQTRRQAAGQLRERQVGECNADYEQRIRQTETGYAEELRQLQATREHELEISQESFERSRSRLLSRWDQGLARIQAEVSRMNTYCDLRFPPWSTFNWRTWTPPREALRALRLGRFQISQELFPQGQSLGDGLTPALAPFELPAALAFPEQPSLLLEAWDGGREAACSVLQNVMLRLISGMPPGTVRFTVIDPVGLGRNFSAFMHLADFDERLIAHRIWTDASHIQQRLIDLTEHMQDVIQKYLRNEFASIEDYNEFAGEVAEPYQILVVANFPAGFTEEAAQRLISISQSGPRCGVYTLISTDARLELPRNFALPDIASRALVLQWDGDRFRCQDPVLRDIPLELEPPPPDQQQTEALRTLGRHARTANRVEVPFTTVAAPEAQWWQADSRGGLEVALGRAGASKLQYLRLGKGTSQHVLIAGKTGSGKSTLLHALIVNLALHYSPREVQFYLIDFKKGVEFKPYAARQLPHARVVAIESEREFGMSVLERLDGELRERGDRFRAAGVQDLAAYRHARPDETLPRLLLVIDEFQEFFVQDDKLAQDAALLLDRLVRQGRAFGIHVLLGSQTLAGAYSLARSTLGQMAVRIALQCSEGDAHLILSEENTAARLLHRPGEAIYNDANGMFEGNHPFQVVWLPAAQQEDYLRRLAERARSELPEPPTPIVFEGSTSAELAENPLLRQALRSPAQGPAAVPTAWLGAAVAIKDPTCVRFRRQNGANLLLVGQQEDQALGVLAAALVSLVATTHRADHSGAPPADFLVLDGVRPDSPLAGCWQQLADRLPSSIQVGGPGEVVTYLASLSQEVKERLQGRREAEHPRFLFVANLARFRELRKADDDYGFSLSGEEKPESPAQQLATVLRDGPAVGLHTLLWCDTYATVQRWLDRQLLRDIDLRVLFQMSANDSSNLMDSPAASRLGNHRALLHSEELGLAEKFRPYGLPSLDWWEDPPRAN